VHAPTPIHQRDRPGGTQLEPAPTPRRSPAAALVAGARPRQWLKNSLVLAAPAAAGVLAQADALVSVALAFAAFCMVASGGYLLNDVSDAEADRRHPRKRLRPVAARELSAGAALAAGIALTLGGIALAGLVSLALLGAVAGYVALSFAYTTWLKRIPVIDIATVASFFVLRAVAGGLAAGVPLSRWFLIVASFGSLFMVAGKRAGEFTALGEERVMTRPTLAAYSISYLRNLRTMAAGVALAAYCLWAFERVRVTGGSPFTELSIIPFVLFVMRYAMLVEEEGDQSPEDLVLHDPGLRAAAVAWMIVFGCGVYLA